MIEGLKPSPIKNNTTNEKHNKTVDAVVILDNCLNLCLDFIVNCCTAKSATHKLKRILISYRRTVLASMHHNQYTFLVNPRKVVKYVHFQEMVEPFQNHEVWRISPAVHSLLQLTVIMATKKKTVRFTDSSLINNDVLRPWTIDVNLDRRLHQEAIALNKILAFTTPQKFAGTLVGSVLDSAPDEFKEFQNTLNQRTKAKLSGSTTLNEQPPVSGNRSNRSNTDSSRLRSNISEKAQSDSGNVSRAFTPSIEDYSDCFEPADLAYIEKLKRNSMRTAMRGNTTHASTIHGIRYSQAPFGPISPSKSKLLLTTYQNPRLNASISHSKIPAVRHNLPTSTGGSSYISSGHHKTHY